MYYGGSDSPLRLTRVLAGSKPLLSPRPLAGLTDPYLRRRVSVLVAVAKEVAILDGTLLAWASLSLQLAIPRVSAQPKFVRLLDY